MANFIRSIHFDMGPDQVRFTIQTDAHGIHDVRRIGLIDIVNNRYSRDEFIALGESCYSLMRDRNFVFYEFYENESELCRFMTRFRGEITLTKEWMDIHSYDIFMNCVFHH